MYGKTVYIDMNLIIDGNNLAYRCRHVFSLSNHGEDVSVTYGFMKVLGSLIKKFKATSVLVCWDGGIPEFRREKLPEYKANRDHGDPEEYQDFLRQVNELRDYALRIIGVVNVWRSGSEADDLVFHASRMLAGDCIIVSSDKDLFQAIGSGVSVFHPATDTLYDAVKVKELCGVPVTSYVDWRAIQGDGSDNIPGVPGIGEKTATKLFAQFGSLTGIYNAALGINPAGQLTGKLAENIKLFGFGNITRNIYITALYADRVGARRAVIDAVDQFVQCDIKVVKRYLLKNAFVSLADSSFLGPVSRIGKPKLNITDKRIPVIPCKRKPA